MKYIHLYISSINHEIFYMVIQRFIKTLDNCLNVYLLLNHCCSLIFDSVGKKAVLVKLLTFQDNVLLFVKCSNSRVTFEFTMKFISK